MNHGLAILVGVFLFFASPARGQDSTRSQKPEGRSFILLPGAGYNPDVGTVGALLAGMYDNGRRSDRYFAEAPYRYAFLFMASASTGGVVSLGADLDVPYVRQSPIRLRARLQYDRNPIESYFGTGEATLEPFRTPEGTVYHNYADYSDDLSRVRNGETYAYYNYYRVEQGTFRVTAERDLAGGRVRASAGGSLSRVLVRDYTGRQVRASDGKATMLPTRLREDLGAGKIEGFRGGWNNTLRGGVVYDTRDQEPNPRNGMFHDAVFQVASQWIGSDRDYAIASVATRVYARPLRGLDVVTAARVGYVARLGEVPFFAMNDIPLSDRYVSGLGGESTLRGYRQSRFVGPAALYANLELRCVPFQSRILKQKVEWIVAPFLDLGRVYDSVEATRLSGMQVSYGAGFRAGVNQAYVLSFDVGISEEESLMPYITVGQVF